MLKLVDISYGGENGFNQAIELSAEVLSNVKFIQEKKLIGALWEIIMLCYLKIMWLCVNNDQLILSTYYGPCLSALCLSGRYFDEISQDTGKYCFGVEDTLKALEMGAVEILIVYENLDTMRYILRVHGAEGNGAENGTHNTPLAHDNTVGTTVENSRGEHKQCCTHTHFRYSAGPYSLATFTLSIHKLSYALRCDTCLQ